MEKSFTVLDLPLEERPRERLQLRGAENISLQELLAIVFGSGTRGVPVMALAQGLLAKFGSLKGLVEASLADLQSVPGLGQAKAVQLKACLEIARRVMREEEARADRHLQSRAIAEPADISRAVRPLIRNWQKEHFFLLSFDNRNRLLGVDLITVGTLNASLVHPRETFKAAVGRHAASIAVCHNHPSGDTRPSEADISVTKRLSEAGTIMGIQLLDHVIISQAELFSCRENKLI